MQKPITLIRTSFSGANIWLILAGLVLGAVAVVKSVADLRAYNASLDPIGLADDQTAGFLPVYTQQELSSSLPSQAPTLESATDNALMPAGSDGALPSPEALEGLSRESTAGGPQGLESEAPEPGQPGGQPVRVPNYLTIPAINLQTDIIPAESRVIESQGVHFLQWLAPDQYRTAGWHTTSAHLGSPGNTVINGHNNIKGEVFRNLDQLSKGDLIFVQSGSETFTYQVKLTTILKERHQPIEVKVENARWILPSDDERITLISCWPYETNSHRVVVVAVPYRSGRGLPAE